MPHAFAHPVGLTCGAFEQLFGTGGWEFDCQKLKNSNAWGLPWCWGYKLIGALSQHFPCHGGGFKRLVHYVLSLELHSSNLPTAAAELSDSNLNTIWTLTVTTLEYYDPVQNGWDTHKKLAIICAFSLVFNEIACILLIPPSPFSVLSILDCPIDFVAATTLKWEEG